MTTLAIPLSPRRRGGIEWAGDVVNLREPSSVMVRGRVSPQLHTLAVFSPAASPFLASRKGRPGGRLPADGDWVGEDEVITGRPPMVQSGMRRTGPTSHGKDLFGWSRPIGEMAGLALVRSDWILEIRQ